MIREEPAPSGATYKTYYNQDQDYDHGMKFAVGTPFKIPEGQYFMMGDSRDNSQDSRFWGTVPRSYIVGRPLYVYWSYNSQDPEGTNFFNFIKWRRMGTALK